MLVTDFVLQGGYSDITVTIGTKQFLLHRVILDSCPYFHDLFQVTNCTTATLKAKCPEIMEDVIRSRFYNQPIKTTDILTYIKYCDRYLIPFPIELLYNLIVPAEKYPFLVKVASLFPATPELANTLKTNRPDDYNKELLPLYAQYETLCAKVVEGNCEMYNSEKEVVSFTIGNIHNIVFSCNNKQLITLEQDLQTVKFYDAQTGKLNYNTTLSHEVYETYTSFDETLLIGYGVGCVCIWRMGIWDLLMEPMRITDVINIQISNNNAYLAIASHTSMKVVHIETGSTCRYNLCQSAYYIFFSDDSNYIISFNGSGKLIILSVDGLSKIATYQLNESEFELLETLLYIEGELGAYAMSNPYVSVIYNKNILTITVNGIFALNCRPNNIQ